MLENLAPNCRLRDAANREGAAWADGELVKFGQKAGSAHALELGRRANEALPKLEPISEAHEGNTVVTFRVDRLPGCRAG